VDSTRDVRLDAIRAGDLEFLRQLRNQERRWFFDQTEITPEAQLAWHGGLGRDPNNHWFMVRVGDQPAGCFSIKVGADHRAEVRCILLANSYRGHGVMTRAIASAMDQLGGHLRYFAEVLPDNEASLGLFKRLGFAPSFVMVERPAR
jgi:RimJ/RimL family protein N-acetyltransferase